MTQTRDLIKKMADFFTGEQFYEKGEDARLELSPDDVRCVNRLIQRMSKIRAEIKAEITPNLSDEQTQAFAYVLQIIDKYKGDKK